MLKKILLLLVTLIISTSNGAYAVAASPCSGPTSLLNIVNRPTNADSACVVPYKKLFIQTGFQYQELLDSNGIQQNLPNAVVSLGLPNETEFAVVLPNYIHQSNAPTQGSTATSFGIKHELGYNNKWIIAVEAYITPPSGSATFGSAGTGIAINGIMNYSMNTKLSLSGMLGGSMQTEPRLSGGGRYSSINPDLVVSYSLKDQLNLFAELYGQNQTAPEQGWGWNSDLGVQYLLTPNVVLDAEVGKRLRGALGSFEQYLGGGISVMLE